MAKGRDSSFYSPFKPPRLAWSELVHKTLDDVQTDALIDRFLQHRDHAYFDWYVPHVNVFALL